MVVSQKGNKYILITHAVNVSNMFEVLLSYIFTSTMNRELAFVFICFHVDFIPVTCFVGENRRAHYFWAQT